jgi:uncharacterized protein (DUF1800 family)
MSQEKKTVLGKKYKNGRKSLKIAIKDLVNHPSCREFIATKLCRYLITDHPTKEMIAPIIKAWEKSDGYLPEVHKAAIKVAFEYNNKYKKNFKTLKIGGCKQLICQEPLTHTLYLKKKWINLNWECLLVKN